MATPAHLLLGFVPHSNTSDVTSVGSFFPFPPSHRRSSLSILKPRAPWRGGGGAINVAARGEPQQHDHYGVLGLRRGASPADIKKAFRLLARKYHPDVSRDVKSGEKFKSIRLAYEVLSDERRRSQYDGGLKFQDSKRYRDYQTIWKDDPEMDIEDRRRMDRWSRLRQQMRYEYYNRRERASNVQGKDPNRESWDTERGAFAEMLWFTFSTLFFMQMIGSRLTLSLCTIVAFLDRRLDAGYKMGHLTALVLGGRAGVMLSLCVSLASWLCGKSSSGAIALLVLAMWVAVNVSRCAPLLPQGAVLVLLYLSIRPQIS